MVKGLLGRVKAPPSIFIDGFFFLVPHLLQTRKSVRFPSLHSNNHICRADCWNTYEKRITLTLSLSESVVVV